MRDFGFGDDQNCEELYGVRTILFDGPLRIDQSRTKDGIIVTLTQTHDRKTFHVNVSSYCPRISAAVQ